MTESTEKLKEDLVILEAMAAEIDGYLQSELLFWPLHRNDLPRLTLGGYLMRQHRLLALRDLLNMDEQARLHAAINQYNEATNEKVVRVEQRAHEEARARLRQWEEYLRDVNQNADNAAYYASAVETRAMLQALLTQLRTPPYNLEPEVPQRLAGLDRNLRRRWASGPFVWPVAWKPAYPKDEFWWLYGHPEKQKW